MPSQNFARVDDRVWRGAWPTPIGARWLADQGVRVSLDLEWETDDAGLFVGLPVRIVRVRDFEPLPFFAPSLADEHVIAALRAIRDGPPIVYVHCRSGQNRTGVVVAAYRLILKGDPLTSVLAEFNSYRGFWAWADESYIRSLAARNVELLARLN